MNPETPTIDTPVQRPHASASTWPPASSRTSKILVVDDDADTRDLNCRLLSRAGYTAEAAADGEQAWNALQSTRYDLLLTDHNMPRLCGLELAARMRAAGMTVPIILNSGCDRLGEAREYPHLGLAAVLQKPCKCTEILEAVKRILPLPPAEAETVHDVPAALAASRLFPAFAQPTALTF